MARTSPTRSRSPWELRDRAGELRDRYRATSGNFVIVDTQKTYVHASEEDLQRGQAALAKIHKIA
jgi:hypothetical protein